MKRVLTFCMLLVLVASVSGCGAAIPVTSNEPTRVFTAFPSQQSTSTPPAAAITISPSAPALQTGTAAVAVTPSSAPTFTALPAAETGGPTVPPAAGEITEEMLKNFTYVISPPMPAVTLTDGHYRDDELDSRLYPPIAFGDLNGDGIKDAAVVIGTEMFNLCHVSCRFFDLIVLRNDNGAPTQISSYNFGNRQSVLNLTIQNGRVMLDYMTHGLMDPVCCPNEHRLSGFILDGVHNDLRLVSEQVLGGETVQATPIPNSILIDQPLSGEPFFSPQTVVGRVGQVPPERKVHYAVTDLSGSLLTQGDVPLEGEPGSPGTFTFQVILNSVSQGILKIEITDAANGILRGRSVVDLIVE